MTGSLWRNGTFVRLWSAYSVSELGSQITLLALPLTALLVLHASVLEIAVLNTFDFLPMLLFGPLAGVWVDRLPHRPLLVIADLAQFALLGSIPLAYAAGVLTLPQLYAVGFVAGAMRMLFTVAGQAYLPALLPREQLPGANARLETSRAFAAIAGPSSAGVLIGLVSAPVAILGDALSFLCSGLAIASIRDAETVPKREVLRGPVWQELREGLRYVRRQPIMRANVLSAAPANFSYGIAWGILVVFAVRDLGLRPATLGLVLAVGQTGGLLGAAVANRLARAFGPGPTMTAACMLAGPDLLLIALAPPSRPLPFLAAGLFLGSFVSLITGIVGVSIRQAIVPLRLQGRVVGSIRWIILGVLPLGSACGGLLASSIGLRATLLVGAAIASFTFVPLVLSPMRRLRVLPEVADALPTIAR